MTRLTTRTRAIARPLLIGLELFVAANAVYGGVGLIVGDALGLPAEWLDGTPWRTFLWPGIFLLLVVAVPMTVAAAGELLRRPWAARASVTAGALQVGWILAQWAIMQRYHPLQPTMLAAGLVVAALALLAYRPPR